MAKTLTCQDLQELAQTLFNSYMKLPVKLGRRFDDYSICISCRTITTDPGACRCGKPVTQKKSKPKKVVSKKKSRKKKSIFPSTNKKKA